MNSNTLYHRLGGRDAIFATVDIFYNRIELDNRINHLFHHMDMARLRSKQKLYLLYAFGGAPGYSGRSLRETHAHVKITHKQFDIVNEHMRATLEQLNVDKNLISEVSALIESTRADILNLPT
ncbi:MAG: group 1 truncated hemoglobin [Micavibrio sp.]|nr:group 1 truncated hemoglobin [Micavibrio sp.]